MLLLEPHLSTCPPFYCFGRNSLNNVILLSAERYLYKLFCGMQQRVSKPMGTRGLIIVFRRISHLCRKYYFAGHHLPHPLREGHGNRFSLETNRETVTMSTPKRPQSTGPPQSWTAYLKSECSAMLRWACYSMLYQSVCTTMLSIFSELN